MKRSLIIAILSMVVTLVMLLVGTDLSLSCTSWGKVMSSRTPMPPDPWEAFAGWYYVLLAYVTLPIVVTVSFLAGFFEKRFPLLLAVLATSPASLLASGLSLRGAWRTAVLVLCAMGAAYLALWCSKGRRKISTSVDPAG